MIDNFIVDNFGIRLLRAVLAMIYALLHVLPADKEYFKIIKIVIDILKRVPPTQIEDDFFLVPYFSISGDLEINLLWIIYNVIKENKVKMPKQDLQNFESYILTILIPRINDHDTSTNDIKRIGISLEILNLIGN